MLKHGISNHQYHADKSAYSSSQIVEFSRNPGKFKAGLTRSASQTEAQLLGSIVHKLVLEPCDFELEYAEMPQFNMRTNEGRARAQAFIDSNHDRTIIAPKMIEQARNMALAVLSDPTADKLLENTAREESGYFT